MKDVLHAVRRALRERELGQIPLEKLDPLEVIEVASLAGTKIIGDAHLVAAPHELFPAALAACVSTTLVMYARTKNWRLDGVDVDVEYDHRATPRRFEIDIRVAGDLSAVQLVMLEKVAAACPVRRGIESGIEFVERLELTPASLSHERGAA